MLGLQGGLGGWANLGEAVPLRGALPFSHPWRGPWGTEASPYWPVPGQAQLVTSSQLPPLSLGWTQQQPPLPKMVGTCPPVCLPRDKGVPAGSQGPRRNIWGPWLIKGGNLKHLALVP